MDLLAQAKLHVWNIVIKDILGIIAVAKHLYGGDKYKNMILELNASDDRGINVVREQIKSFCSTQ